MDGCPSCNAIVLVKAGRNPSGSQCYQCKCVGVIARPTTIRKAMPKINRRGRSNCISKAMACAASPASLRRSIKRLQIGSISIKRSCEPRLQSPQSSIAEIITSPANNSAQMCHRIMTVRTTRLNMSYQR